MPEPFAPLPVRASRERTLTELEDVAENKADYFTLFGVDYQVRYSFEWENDEDRCNQVILFYLAAQPDEPDGVWEEIGLVGSSFEDSDQWLYVAGNPWWENFSMACVSLGIESIEDFKNLPFYPEGGAAFVYTLPADKHIHANMLDVYTQSIFLSSADRRHREAIRCGGRNSDSPSYWRKSLARAADDTVAGTVRLNLALIRAFSGLGWESFQGLVKEQLHIEVPPVSKPLWPWIRDLKSMHHIILEAYGITRNEMRHLVVDWCSEFINYMIRPEPQQNQAVATLEEGLNE